MPSQTPTEVTLSSPGDKAYEQAVACYNLDAHLDPAHTVIATCATDVINAILTARNLGMGVRAQATGHAAMSASPMYGDLLISTQLAEPVIIDPVASTARISAGTCWSSVVDAAAAHGLIALHGSSGTIGAIGYLLRGGLSFYGRLHGIAANSLRSITIVIATGETIEVSATSVPELFWALRGGGGGYGVVVGVEIQLFPMAHVITGQIAWKASDAAVIATLWKKWTETAPPEATTSLRMLNLPPVPGMLPEVLTSGQILMIDGAISVSTTGDLDAAQQILEDFLGPLRGAIESIFDSWAVAPPAALPHTHLDPPFPVPSVSDHLVLDYVDDLALGRILDAAGDKSSLLMFELRQLGGRLAEPAITGGAFDRIRGSFSYFGVGLLATPESRKNIVADLAVLRGVLSPWSTGFTLPTFVENAAAPQRTLDEADFARAAVLRARIDPTGMFAHDVSPVRADLLPA